MEARLQRRVQRYGWDLAAPAYEALWHAQLAPAHAALLEAAALAPGERVLDVACGSGALALRCADAVGAAGDVVGVDLSGAMVAEATRRARAHGSGHATFLRMDAEHLDVDDASVDVAVCAFGLMYVPDPAQAIAEMNRVVRPGGRVVVAVWGRAAQCGFAPLFRVVEAEVASDVCPLFFRLGEPEALARLCADAGLASVDERRIAARVVHADADEACNAAFLAGPVALAWSRFDDHVRARVRSRYLDAIAPWRDGRGYRLPAEFVVVAARACRTASARCHTAAA